MQFITHLAVVTAAMLPSALAVPQPQATTTSVASMPGHYECSSVTTITSTVGTNIHCLREAAEVCIRPTSTCQPGEPTGRSFPTVTSYNPPSCTVDVLIKEGGCGYCASCLAAPTA
ncbi:Uu.00g137640.m01.CDS01 [Anthostomella pinea]|uniref:Uu.00g137640.m01.CDS01 n=1 Tax=Anthostomella pinea TaxID=933095 RepID=A0AAI8VPJ3_9PEZI|nr:Uu.00g137640.m01.CDS01 [Anthostomella pinea]